MRKRITSALLTLVMLLSLVPAMGTTASAAATTGSGSKDDPYIVTTYADLKAKLQSKGTTYIKVTGMDHKVSIPLSDGGRVWVSELKVGKDFESKHAAIDIPNGAHKYLEIATDLWFMGDAQKNVTGYPPAIFERLIDLNAGASLTITGNRTLRVDFNTMLTRNAIIVNWGGDLTIDGDVTLDARQEMFNNIHGTALHLEAGTTNIHGGTFWGDHKYTTASAGDGGVIRIPDTKADPKLYISGGTFEAVNACMDEGWKYGLDCKNTNATVSLTGGTFKTGISSVGNISELLAEDFKFFKNDAVFDGAVTKTKDTLSVRHSATLGGATLNVGGNAHPAGDKNFNHVVTSNDASKKLFVSFDAGPQWFTTYYLKNKINLNASVSIWKAGERQNDVTIVQSAGGLPDGRLSFTLDVGNLSLEPNNTYTVSLYVDPTMNGERLAEDYLLTQWTFRTEAEPEDKAITAVGLKQDFYLTDDSSTNEPDIDISGNSQPYTIKDEGSWTTTDGETYTRTVTLEADKGYKFTNSTKVTAVNNDGAKPVDGVNKVLNEDGTLSVTITTYKRYEVRFRNEDETSTGNAAQYIRKDYKATAPDLETVPSGKVFVGWKQNLNDDSEEAILPGDQTAKITGNTTYYAVLEDAPNYSITLSKLLVEPKVAVGEEATFYLTIENTGNADTGSLTVFFRMNSGNHFKFTNDVEDSKTHDSITEGVTLKDDESELTIPSIAAGKSVNIKLTLPGSTDIGDYGCAVQVKSADSSSTLKSNIVLVKTTVAKQILINLYHNTTPINYEHEVPFVGDIVELDEVTPNPHETFVGWTANKNEIVFEDPTAPTTRFVMPDIDVSSEELAITANFAVATVNGIAVTQMPAKTDYKVDDHFDPTGIKVKLTYSDGTTEDLPEGATLTFDPNTSTALTTANTSVKVSYTPEGGSELSTYLTITVKKPDANTYTVTYNPGEGSGYMEPGTATEGEKFSLPTTCTFTPPTGKVFDKWQIGGTDYQPGQYVTIPGNTTVTAIWKELPTDGSVELVPLPTANTGLVYTGSKQIGVEASTGSGYTLTGTTEAIDAGTYYAYAQLKSSDPSKTYYWTDGTQQSKLIEWTINLASQAAPTGPLEMDTRTTDSITLKTIPGAEYSMDGSYWQSSPEFTGLSSGTSYTFFARIPASADGNYSASDAITATFSTLSGSSSSGSSSGSTTYTVTVLDSANGSVTADRKTAPAGAVVTLTVTADKGCALETLTVLDKSGKEIKLTEKNGKYTFTMPASSVTVEAVFKAEKSGSPFVDVPSGSYYEDAVIWAADKGITGGTDAAHFAPNGVCTRAQAVTFLWRAAGSPAPKSAAMPFTDVKAGSYYEQAVLWAVENGITKGTSDTTFSPDLTCTRAQIVTFLWRSQKSPAAGSENPFTDVKSDAYYADAVLWAVKENVTSGTAAATFSPDTDCTRAQIVTFIYRALAE